MFAQRPNTMSVESSPWEGGNGPGLTLHPGLPACSAQASKASTSPVSVLHRESSITPATDCIRRQTTGGAPQAGSTLQLLKLQHPEMLLAADDASGCWI